MSTEPLSDIGQWVLDTVKKMVDYPDKVQVEEITGRHSTVLELTVDKEDIGKVIGRKGVHAEAIRRIMYALAGKQRKRYVLEIIE